MIKQRYAVLKVHPEFKNELSKLLADYKLRYGDNNSMQDLTYTLAMKKRKEKKDNGLYEEFL